MTELSERDGLDERLTAAGRAWQVTQPPAPGVPLDRLDEPLPGATPWRTLAVAAVAVLVVAGGAIALTRSQNDAMTPPVSGTPTITSPTTEPTGPLVPWKNLPAGHPDVRHREHGQVVTPFDRISATGTISGHLHPGDLLTFTAVIQSPTRLVLDPCPDFNIAFGKHSWHTWQLNCAQVPFRDKAGRPFLPAFRDVRFAMQVRAPQSHGEQKVLWTLNGPQSMPGFYGLVRVTD